MYSEIINKVYDFRGLGSTEKAILAYLAKYADEEGRGIFPGNEKIAYHTNFALITVKITMKKLEEAELIIADGKYQRRNQYRLNFDRLMIVSEQCKPSKQPRKTTLTPYVPDAPAPTNGNGHDDPYKRRDGESLMAWSRRVNALPRKG